MYKHFFSFKRKPFELLPNPDFLFPSRSHKKALTYLDYGIKEKAGFILLTGEVGAGKTTLVRNMVRVLRDDAPLAIVFNTSVDNEQLIGLINDDFGLETQGKDKVALVRDLNSFLIDQFSRGQQPILIIDEAQNLSPAHLEEVRLLSNLETENAKLLQIILVGQPELRDMLARPELRQLRQRISISCHLNPLNREETGDYISHRLEIAGNRDAITFSDEAFDSVHEFSRGIPRLINIVCDYLLLAAYSEETQDISMDMVREVLADIEVEHSYWTDKEPPVRETATVATAPQTDDLKQLRSRLEYLERISADERLVEEFQSEIFEKITETNQYVTGVFDRYRQEFSRMSSELTRVLNEVEGLKRMLAVRENGADQAPEVKPAAAKPVPVSSAKKDQKPEGIIKRLFG